MTYHAHGMMPMVTVTDNGYIVTVMLLVINFYDNSQNHTVTLVIIVLTFNLHHIGPNLTKAMTEHHA